MVGVKRSIGRSYITFRARPVLEVQTLARDDIAEVAQPDITPPDRARREGAYVVRLFFSAVSQSQMLCMIWSKETPRGLVA